MALVTVVVLVVVVFVVVVVVVIGCVFEDDDGESLWGAVVFGADWRLEPLERADLDFDEDESEEWSRVEGWGVVAK
jgi:hypothetical protein